MMDADFQIFPTLLDDRSGLHEVHCQADTAPKPPSAPHRQP
jgi:hypothetical protein